MGDVGSVAISAKGVQKRYDGFTAVAGIDLTIYEGEIFGIVGPNGAGKTTLLKMLCGLISESEGEIKILGHDFAKNATLIKKNIGYLPEESPLYENMRVMDYLIFFSEIFGVEKGIAKSRIRETLSALDLPFHRKKIGDLSKGMKRKVAIARSLINDPKILIYDEPTSGLDPMTSKYITDFVRELKSDGKTIIFSAHNLYQVESICDRVLIMSNGKKIVNGKIDEIIREYGSVEYQIEFAIDNFCDLRLEGVESCNGNYLVRTSDINNLNRIAKQIIGCNGDIVEMRTCETSLEEIFLALVGRSVV